ncbi:MAG TPA: FhaA domain-containing protein [Anaerolineaceae bacterium]
MKPLLIQMESQLQQFIENRLAFLSPANSENTLAHRLIETMQDNLTPAGKYLQAPITYILHLHPDNLSLWKADPELINDLASFLESAAGEYNIQFPSKPVIRLKADPDLPIGQIRVEIPSDSKSGGITALVEQPDPQNPLENLTSPRQRAFLIINGNQMVSLTQPVINIGRRPDNQIVLNHAQVSRTHAQIRSVRGQNILFDLNSTGGTYVNGQRIHQWTLKSGDVISLAGVAIIYGEENTPSPPHLHPGDTQTLHLPLDQATTPRQNRDNEI